MELQQSDSVEGQFFSDHFMKIFFFMVVALCAFALALLPYLRPIVMTDIRIKNETGYQLRNIMVNGGAYGDLPIGGVSGYQKLPHAHDYASYEFVAVHGELRKEVRLFFDDNIGLIPLGKGRYSYVLQHVPWDMLDTENILYSVSDGD